MADTFDVLLFKCNHTGGKITRFYTGSEFGKQINSYSFRSYCNGTQIWYSRLRRLRYIPNRGNRELRCQNQKVVQYQAKSWWFLRKNRIATLRIQSEWLGTLKSWSFPKRSEWQELRATAKLADQKNDNNKEKGVGRSNCRKRSHVLLQWVSCKSI
jgi:hypothetical protein